LGEPPGFPLLFPLFLSWFSTVAVRAMLNTSVFASDKIVGIDPETTHHCECDVEVSGTNTRVAVHQQFCLYHERTCIMSGC
jgi:hypothetical protein